MPIPLQALAFLRIVVGYKLDLLANDLLSSIIHGMHRHTIKSEKA
jgi:hypothetical protein